MIPLKNNGMAWHGIEWNGNAHLIIVIINRLDPQAR